MEKLWLHLKWNWFKVCVVLIPSHLFPKFPAKTQTFCYKLTNFFPSKIYAKPLKWINSFNKHGSHSSNISIISIHTKKWPFSRSNASHWEHSCHKMCLPFTIGPICVSVWLICSVPFFTINWIFRVKNFRTHKMCVSSIQTPKRFYKASVKSGNCVKMAKSKLKYRCLFSYDIIEWRVNALPQGSWRQIVHGKAIIRVGVTLCKCLVLDIKYCSGSSCERVKKGGFVVIGSLWLHCALHHIHFWVCRGRKKNDCVRSTSG